ncbi:MULTISPECIES: amidase [Sporosarcina]|uniref:Aspartyl-tRNA(Asn)/glutamyl-tRNA(Gln) amidotransferase subunit A n=1 Tax=Sporosarcina newyorkensis TaxID=759851 RepID=A0A1T4Y0D5_9BACL|nr:MULTISPECIES: amidase [Sporosarcina]MBY0221488.1 Asp-tRNA(Asn)/Glu-tRNA(Gln) amidotransferase GatCAB subunit A [Sporosarcina aquimarina]SKA95284.1 aspartyl-tRNA(Asn)/glutamyl-tRNA(Gln) amidotransferase subunit A [Sporosarcina newyorkensis]
MAKELIQKSVEELAPLIQNGSLSPVDLTKAVLDHAEDTQESINAYMTIYRDEAEQSAREAEKEIKEGKYRGMYHGIPMALKDNLYFKNKVTTMSSKIHKDFVPDDDATVVSKLRDAGVIFTGKLSMHEYAWGITNNNPHYGAVRNPWDTDKIPGGSSGGSGAAVAVGSSVASLGTDTAGSIRIPSSICGIVGLKPTHGRVSKYGCYPLAWTLDHIGPMTKTIKDAAGMMDIISGYDQKDPTSVNTPVNQYLQKIQGNVKDLVIGVNEEYFFKQVDNEVDQIVRKNIQALVDQGAKVEIVNIPSLQYAEWAELVTSLSEASAIHHEDMLKRPQDFGDDIRMLFELGELPSAVDYLQAQQVRRQLKQEFQQAFQKVDVMIAPTLPVVASTIGDDTVDLNGQQVDLIDNIIRFTGPSNLTGLPALSVPGGLKGNLPVGVQIIGPAFAEARILDVGYAIEQTNPMKDRKPELLTRA